MQTVKRKVQAKWSALAGPLMIIAGLVKLLGFYQELSTDESSMSVGGYYGAALDGFFWIGLGVIAFMVARRSKKLPAIEYDDSEVRIIRANAFGSHRVISIPMANVTKFQSSEPGTTDIYFMKNGDETIENVTADAIELEQFRNYVNARKAKFTTLEPTR